MGGTHLLTAEEFFELPDPPDRRVELVLGLIRGKPHLVVIAGLVKANVLTSLSEFLKLHELGLVLPGLGCVLGRNPCPLYASDAADHPRCGVLGGYRYV